MPTKETSVQASEAVIDLHCSTTTSVGRIAYLAIKRLFDLTVSLFGIILLIPATIIVKILYICTGDFASIFYKQTRIGKDGREFGMFKFRTMVKDSDEQLAKMLKQKKYRDEWTKNHKIENDPRITKIGKVLRKTSIDEIPQFLNIFAGQLSLIGPRPLVPGEIEEYHGNKQLYESVKPGLTGWWAVNGRSNTKHASRLELEYYYAEHNSLALDTKIIILTIPAVFKGNGAR